MKRWIDEGAKGPAKEEAVSAVSKHWSFQSVQRPALPAVKNAAWPRNEIDRFVLARLEKEGIAPSPEADKSTLIRRVSLDLTGLPPTPARVDEFLRDVSRKRMSGWLIACSIRPTMANARPATGSMPHVMRTRMALRSMPRDRFGNTATG